MNKYEEFKKAINDSHRCELDCFGVLTVTDYDTGKTVTLNLNWVTEEMFEELHDSYADDDEEDEE